MEITNLLRALSKEALVGANFGGSHITKSNILFCNCIFLIYSKASSLINEILSLT